MTGHPLTAKGAALRQMVKDAAELEKPVLPCRWCENVNERGLTDTTSVASPGDPQCNEHHALNVAISRYMNRLPIAYHNLDEQWARWTAEGIAIAVAKERMAA
jgi:hypothetical protein